MRIVSTLLLATALVGAGTVYAQTAAKAPAAAPVTALNEIVSPRGNELTAAGIQKITATTNKNARAIRVDSPWGASYFAWPKNVKPVAFTIETSKGGTAVVRAAGYSEANKADYKAAIDAIIPIAKQQTENNKAAKEHRGTKKM